MTLLSLFSFALFSTLLGVGVVVSELISASAPSTCGRNSTYPILDGSKPTHDGCLDTPVIVHTGPSLPLQKRDGDAPGNRQLAVYTNHTELPGCDDCLGKGYCGAIDTIAGFGAGAPSSADCDAIRAWAQDGRNRGRWHVNIHRMVDIPWVPLITAGTCAVVVGTDYKETYRDGIVVGTEDVARLVGRAVDDYQGDGTSGVTGSWAYCLSPAFRGDGLAQWPARFGVMSRSLIP